MIFRHKIRQDFFILAIAILALGVSMSANAQTPAASPCDPLYYDSLESRAWLEAQREITQNQNLIFKPDSVLEYTCFDSFLSHLASQESSMFSGGNDFSGASVNTNMSSALQDLVGSAISSYLSGNFDHSMLGGQLSSVTYSYSSVSNSAYSCDMMQRVWETAAGTAKCRDFINNSDYDGFYTFAEYQSGANGSTGGLGDRRRFPSQCTSIGSRWQQEMDTALTPDNTPWQEDDVVTYLDRMDPANCGSASNPENPPIITGLTVKRNEMPTDYVEKVCVTPGCFYDPTSGNCTANP